MIGDSIGAAVGAEKRRKEAAAESRRAREDRERALAMAADANYEPFLVRDMIDPYQKSQSPMARGYLESYLSGANPDAISSTRAGAPALKQAAQGRFDQATGGWDSLRGQQAAAQQATPWATRGLKEAPVTDDMRWTAKLGQGGRIAMERLGLTQDDLAALERLGISVDARKGDLDGLSKAADKEVKAINKMAGDPAKRDLFEQYLQQLRGGSAGGSSAQYLWNGRTLTRDEQLRDEIRQAARGR